MSNTVITYRGEEVPRNLCRKIENTYYKIGDRNIKDSGDCYLIDGTYYRVNTNRIAWNESSNMYDLRSNLVKGYLDKGGIGYFTFSVTENMVAADDLYLQSEMAAVTNGLMYDYSCGLWKKSQNVIMPNPEVGGRFKPTYKSLPTDIYNSNEISSDIVDDVEIHSNTVVHEPSVFDKYFYDYKFGQEIETDGGWLPENYYYKFGCLPLKDGSIKGTEITTLVHNPSFNKWKNMYTAFAKYTRCTSNNSLHVNISGFKNTPEFRIAMYVLYYRLQQELAAIIPIYKRDLSYLVNKPGGPKDHCKPLETLGIVKKYSVNNQELLKKELEQSELTLFKMLNEGTYDDNHNFKTRRHIKQNAPKWEWQNRYFQLNYIPLYFGSEKSSRLEWRLHHGTVNPIKALVWLFTVAAITKYVEDNYLKILEGRDKINLDDIFRYCYMDDSEEGQFLFHYILEYFQSLKEENIANVISQGDLYKCFKNDHTYSFAIKGTSLLNYEEKQRSKKKRS